MWAASISDKSASQRDSGHCSGYQAAPSNNDGEYDVAGACAATGTETEINNATQNATFLSITAFSILPGEALFVSIGKCRPQRSDERAGGAESFRPHRKTHR